MILKNDGPRLSRMVEKGLWSYGYNSYDISMFSLISCSCVGTEGTREREKGKYNVVKTRRAGNHEGTSAKSKLLLPKYLHNHVREQRLVMTIKLRTVTKQDSHDEQHFTWIHTKIHKEHE